MAITTFKADVHHVAGLNVTATSTHHTITVDEPESLGGTDKGVFLQIGVHSMGTIFQQHRRLVSSRNCVVGSAAFFLVIWS